MAKRSAASQAALAAEYRELSVRTAAAAMTAAPGHELVVLEASEKFSSMAVRIERQIRKSDEAAIAVLPANATMEEVRISRQRQATRRGEMVYLPSWGEMAQALPTAEAAPVFVPVLTGNFRLR